MRLRESRSMLRTFGVLLSLCLVGGAVGANPVSRAAGDAGDAGGAAPAPGSCWTITGPFMDGRETFFEASNQCDSPRHCQVWVNSHEPPYMVHLEPGMSGRIDVGGTVEGDSFSQDCAPIGVYGDHGD